MAGLFGAFQIDAEMFSLRELAGGMPEQRDQMRFWGLRRSHGDTPLFGADYSGRHGFSG
jgi:hypothetical protein